MSRYLTAICIFLILLIDFAAVISGATQRPLTVLIGDVSIAFGAYVLGLTRTNS